MSLVPEQDRIVYQSIAEPKLQAKLLTNWSPLDIMVSILLGLGVIASWVWLEAFLSLVITAVATSLLYRSSRGYGRFYWEIYTDFKSWYIDKILGGVLWSAEPVGNRFVRWLRSHYRAIPLRLSRIEVEIEDVKESFGLLRQTDGTYDYLYIAADGGSFSGLDVNQEANAVSALAGVVNEAVMRANYLKVGMSFLRVTSPYDLTELANNLRRSMNPIVAHPERFNLDNDTRDWVDWSVQNAEEVRNELVRLGAAKNWYLIVLTIKSNIPKREKKRSKLTNKQLYEQPVVELGRSLVKNLREADLLGLRNVHCMGMAELALLVRASWDVTGLYEYMAARDRGEIPSTDEEIDEFLETHDVSELDGYLRAWPERIISVSSKQHFIRMDDNYVSTLRVERMPERIRADQFRSLHYRVPAGIWLRRAMVGQSVSGTAQTNHLVVSQSFFMNVQGAFSQNNIVEHPKVAKRRAMLREQAEEMSSTTIAQHYNQLQTVVATSESLLLTQRKEVEVKYGNSGFRSGVVPRSARQMDAAIGGMLGINRL